MSLTTDELHRIYIDARHEVDRFGWIQGVQRGDDGEVCTIGALGAAVSRFRRVARDLATEPREGRLEHVVRQFSIHAEIPADVGAWNDSRQRTYEELWDAFDRAIEATRPDAGLDGPSRPVRVEPVKIPDTTPREAPAPAPPVEQPTHAPAEPVAP